VDVGDEQCAKSPRGVLRHSTTFSSALIMLDRYQSRVSVL
jgi:hypothetical protein